MHSFIFTYETIDPKDIKDYSETLFEDNHVDGDTMFDELEGVVRGMDYVNDVSFDNKVFDNIMAEDFDGMHAEKLADKVYRVNFTVDLEEEFTRLKKLMDNYSMEDFSETWDMKGFNIREMLNPSSGLVFVKTEDGQVTDADIELSNMKRKVGDNPILVTGLYDYHF